MMIKTAIIKKLKSGKYRLYSKKKGKDGKRKNLGTYDSLAGAKQREKEVQTFKHMADDGKSDSKCDKVVKLMSDMAGYLEEAGFIDASQNVYDAMCAVDGSLSDDEDYAYDMVASVPDVQNALPGSMDYTMTGEVAGGMQGTFNVPEATRGGVMLDQIIKLANHLDKLGLYEEADELDKIAAGWSEYEAGMGRVPTNMRVDFGPDPDFDPEFESREKDLDAEIAMRTEIGRSKKYFSGLFAAMEKALRTSTATGVGKVAELYNDNREDIVEMGSILGSAYSNPVYLPGDELQEFKVRTIYSLPFATLSDMRDEILNILGSNIMMDEIEMITEITRVFYEKNLD